MNTHPGNGKQGDPEGIRMAVERATEKHQKKLEAMGYGDEQGVFIGNADFDKDLDEELKISSSNPWIALNQMHEADKEHSEDAPKPTDVKKTRIDPKGTPTPKAGTPEKSAPKKETAEEKLANINKLRAELDALVAKGEISREDADKKMKEVITSETGFTDAGPTVKAPEKGSATPESTEKESAPTQLELLTQAYDSAFEKHRKTKLAFGEGNATLEDVDAAERDMFAKYADIEALNNPPTHTEGVPVSPIETAPKEAAPAKPASLEDRVADLEGRMAKYEAELAAMRTEADQRAEKAGVLDKVRSVSDWYQSIPWIKKVYFGAGLGALAGITAVSAPLVAGAATGALLAQRVLAGFGTYFGTEGMLQKAAEKGGTRKRTEAETARHMAIATVAGMLVASGAAGHVMGQLLHAGLDTEVGKALKHGAEHTFKNTTDFLGITDSSPNISAAPGAALAGVAPSGVVIEPFPETTSVPVGASEFTAVKGSTVWGGIAEKMSSQPGFAGLQEGQRTYIIDALKNKLSTMSPADLKLMGISSGNIDQLAVGDKVNFTSLMSNQELIQKATEQAQALTPDQIHNIEAFKGGVASTLPHEAVLTTSQLPEEVAAPTDTTLRQEPAGMTPSSSEKPIDWGRWNTPQGTEATLATSQLTDSAPVAPSPASPAASLEAVKGLHSNSTIESGNFKAKFEYSPSGDITKVNIEGTSNSLEGQKMLNDNWRSITRGEALAHHQDMNMGISIVNMNATNVAGYEQLLHTLEANGQGTSPEAGFLRETINNIINTTEKDYGDVFKNLNEGASISAPLPPSVAESMSQTITPASPEILAEANKTLKVDLDRILGKSGGFLGFGGTSGIETPDWKNPATGFANKSVEEVLAATTRPGATGVGIENFQKTSDLQNYIKSVQNFSGRTPMPGEKVADYIKRGAIGILENQKPLAV